MAKKTIDDIQVAGKRVLVRCDFNVPMVDGKITSDKRIVAALPTIKKLIADGGKVILCSHMGKPKNGPEAKFSLAPVAERLSDYLGKPVVFADDDNVVGEKAKAAVAAMKDGDVVLLQNTRFRKEETKNEENFSKELASLADCYVDDAFGSCHRAHCSTEGVTKFLSPCVAGYLIGKELSIMGKALEDPARPFVAVLGGAKVSDKIGVINNLLEKVDTLIVGGGMSYTFQVALGGHVGKSLLEADKVELAKELMAKAKEKGVKFLLPVDNEAGDSFSNDCMRITVHSKEIPDNFEGMDIGPKTQVIFANEIANAMAECKGVTIVGGGDSASAIEQMGFADKVTHVSTGGGASLEFLEGKTLPGVACLDEK